MMNVVHEMEHLDDELRDAKMYANMATEYKTSDLKRGRMYYEMACDELKHAGFLHEMLMKDTESNRDNNEYAKIMWDKVHSDYSDMYVKVKCILNMFEGK